MANKIDTNPIRLDTFGSDITVALHSLTVTGIHFYSGTATDHFSLQDKNGVEVCHLIAGGAVQIGAPLSLNNPPYKVVVADGAYAATAKAFIYKK